MHPKRTRHDTHTHKMAWSTWEWTCNEQSKSIRFYIFLERKRVFMVKWQFSFHSVIPSVSLAIFSTRRLSYGFVEYSQAAYFAIRLIVERILATYLFIQLTVLVSYIMKFKIHSNEVLCISNLFIYIYIWCFFTNRAFVGCLRYFGFISKWIASWFTERSYVLYG